MDRAVFLVGTSTRIPCFLNPAQMVMRRVSGISRRQSIGGMLTGGELADDPLLYTGGGRTELTLDLLFDVLLPGASVRAGDVRDLTGPLWQLAENNQDLDSHGNDADYLRPPTARLFWGKVWNFPCVIAAIAERLEEFDTTGAPRRSWMRMRLWRIDEAPRPQELQPVGDIHIDDIRLDDGAQPGATQVVLLDQVFGDGQQSSPLAPDELCDVSYRATGSPLLYKVIAALNGLDDPLRVPPGTVVRVPTQLGQGRTL